MSLLGGELYNGFINGHEPHIFYRHFLKVPCPSCRYINSNYKEIIWGYLN